MQQTNQKNNQPIQLNTVAVLGGQWGDEGKGKIVDWISEHFDVTARATGGNNAGHTIYIKDEKHVFHLLPSSITRPNKLSILGPGMVLDLPTLIKEINTLNQKGYSTKNLRISGAAHVILPIHILQDGYRESGKSSHKHVGTTKRGIGPTYSDKMRKVGIRVNDLYNEPLLKQKIKSLLTEKLGIFKHLQKIDEQTIKQDINAVIAKANLNQAEKLQIKTHITNNNLTKAITFLLTSLAKQIEQYVTDSTHLINHITANNKTLLLEGAQGLLLDIDHGTYPYTTSSNPSLGGLYTGLGIKNIDRTYSVIKSYLTCVGVRPFPTELEGDELEHIRKVGHEYGSTTARPRRCGYLDALQLRYLRKINGKHTILTKLDVLKGIKELKICNSYKYLGKTQIFNGETYFKGKIISNFPADSHLQEFCVPHEVIKTKGFQEDIQNITTYEELPSEAKQFINLIETTSGVQIDAISTGPKRDQIITIPGRWPFKTSSISTTNTQTVNQTQTITQEATNQTVSQQTRPNPIKNPPTLSLEEAFKYNNSTPQTNSELNKSINSPNNNNLLNSNEPLTNILKKDTATTAPSPPEPVDSVKSFESMEKFTPVTNVQATNTTNSTKISNIKAIIYDLDNTLIATNNFVFNLLKRTATNIQRKYLFPIPTDEQIRNTQAKNLPFEDIFKELFPKNDNFPRDTHEQDFWQYVLQEYRKLAPDIPYPATNGAVDTIRHLGAKNIAQGIVTNRVRMASTRLDQAGFPDDSFLFIEQPRSKEERKPDPRSLIPAIQKLQQLNIDKDQIVMIGDHLHDYEASARANIKFIGITTGSTTKEDFQAANLEENLIIPSLSKLPELLNN